MLEPLPLFTPKPAPSIVTQALDNSVRWQSEALSELERLWRECRHQENEFLFSMLRFPIVKSVGHPLSQNAWGGLAREAVKRGWIQCCGTANGSGLANGSIRRIYRWCQS